MKRDGQRCFYCHHGMPKEDTTIEHLLDVKYGGSHHIKNLVLAHFKCNQGADGLSIPQKFEKRESLMEIYELW